MAQPNRRIGERRDGTVPPAGELELFTEFLVSARQRAGRSLDEIALVTKVPGRHLDALEQGRVDDLPRGVYRRAIIRTYATAIGLDPSIVLERFGQVFGAETAFSEWQLVPPPSRTRPASMAVSTAQESPATLVSPRRTGAPQNAPPRPRGSVSRQTSFIVGAAVAAGVLVAAGYLLISPGETASSAAVPAGETAPAPGAPVTAVNTSGASSVAGADAVRRIVDTTAPQPPPQDAAPVEPEDAGISEMPAESRLVITSNPPEARVTVDGIGWGVTPITIRHLPPGVKVIRLTKEGYLGQEREVRIGEDGAAAVRITLQPRS